MLRPPRGPLGMRQFLIAAGLIALVLIPCKATYADRAGCQDAVDAFNIAREDIADTLKRYADCVRASSGSNDCSTEFQHLTRAHNDFATAVLEHESQCQ
jgi:hypothetical protein